MTFPREALSAAVTARAETWKRLGMIWRVRPVAPNYGKAVVVSGFESATWLGDLLVWITGETELSTLRTTDDRIVDKHHDLSAGCGGHYAPPWARVCARAPIAGCRN